MNKRAGDFIGERREKEKKERGLFIKAWPRTFFGGKPFNKLQFVTVDDDTVNCEGGCSRSITFAGKL